MSDDRCQYGACDQPRSSTLHDALRPSFLHSFVAASPPAADPLDVRLVEQALRVALNCGGCDKDERHAKRFAAEYARLARVPEGERT